MFSLPPEVQLDIFKFLNYEELCSTKQTNLYFRDFIYNFEGELAREEFEDIKIGYFSQFKKVPHKLIKIKENFDFAFFAEQHKEVNEQIELKWSNGLQNPIRLYLPDGGLISSKVIIWVTKGNLIFVKN
uniref:F-box domain-containing protein n=1 Tax=Meloidogyne incognita TaxID=6306 RepID=A0A914N6U0_MELIC